MSRFSYFLLTMVCLTACSACRSNEKNVSKRESEPLWMLVGTYTDTGGSRGIYLYRFDASTGRTDSVGMVNVSNPSFLTLAPDHRTIYAVSENGPDNSYLHRIAFDPATGRLTHIDSLLAGGSSPCYVEVAADGQTVALANYGSGSLSLFRFAPDGRPITAAQSITFTGNGPDTARQRQPHLHSVRFTPNGRYLLAADLGTDRLYRFDTPMLSQPFDTSSFHSVVLPAGTGPRHFDYSADGRFVYLLGELSGQVLVYAFDNGSLRDVQQIAADSVGGRGSADIHLSPDGRHLYASNRLKADGIAIFAVDPADGRLTHIGYQPTGRHPRNFALTPDGRMLLVACRDENRIQCFRRDQATGLLTDAGNDIAVARPVCVRFVAIKER